jgi:hypothetical protein
MTDRLPTDVLNDHLQLRASGDLATDLERNYSPSVVLLCELGVFHGVDEVKASAPRLGLQLLNARFDYLSVQVDGEFGFLKWTADSDRCRVPEGADSYVIRDGRIVMQTIHYRLEPKDGHA